MVLYVKFIAKEPPTPTPPPPITSTEWIITEAQLTNKVHDDEVDNWTANIKLSRLPSCTHKKANYTLAKCESNACF